MSNKAKGKFKRATEAKGSCKDKCSLCHRGPLKGDNDLATAGKFWQLGTHYFHYFCVLFSKQGLQSGKDDQGLHGFLYPDILNLIKVTRSKKCRICSQPNATSQCKKCTMQYHYTCGQKKGSLFVFKGSMDSFCDGHWPTQSLKLSAKFDRICLAGCQEKVTAKQRSLVSPCCKRIYHLACLQSMALVSGKAHFKCPVCSNNILFVNEALKFGIYAPEKDADWENPALEDFYNFEAMARQREKCDVKKCFCKRGRDYNLPGSLFEIITCTNCGSKGAHIKCGNLMKKAPYFICNDHSNALKEMREYKKKAIKRLRQENVDFSDDQDMSEKESESSSSGEESEKQKSESNSEEEEEEDDDDDVGLRQFAAELKHIFSGDEDDDDEMIICPDFVLKPFKIEDAITKKRSIVRTGSPLLAPKLVNNDGISYMKQGGDAGLPQIGIPFSLSDHVNKKSDSSKVFHHVVELISSEGED